MKALQNFSRGGSHIYESFQSPRVDVEIWNPIYPMVLEERLKIGGRLNQAALLGPTLCLHG